MAYLHPDLTKALIEHFLEGIAPLRHWEINFYNDRTRVAQLGGAAGALAPPMILDFTK